MNRLLLIASVVLACVSPAQDNTRPPPPPPAGSLDTVFIAGHALYVPRGFTVKLFAEGLNNVRYLALGPGGAVYASLPAGQIVRLVDANGDGVADGPPQTVLGGLSGPFGIAFRGDTMYFAEQTAVKRLDPGATTPLPLVSGLPSGGHGTRTVVIGPDNRMYVAVGSSCNVCPESDTLRAAVTRFNLDGSGGRIFARGLRNSVGLAFHPTTGELWANNNDRDNLGDDVPPEHLNILKDGRWYGWPQCYLPHQPNPEFAGTDCSGVEPPALTVQAHSAPLGLAFYTGTIFPSEYRGDGFMTYHGSWNRSQKTGYKVVRVRVQGGRPTSVEDFVTGWLVGESVWGRPVGVVVASDGSLLVSDDLGDRIWRVSYGR
jgi:glucose/arabinose dehydrogenase